jgi:hypothetical protein
MEPKSLLQLLQESVTWPYFEPDQSNTRSLPYPISWRYILILSIYLNLGS